MIDIDKMIDAELQAEADEREAFLEEWAKRHPEQDAILQACSERALEKIHLKIDQIRTMRELAEVNKDLASVYDEDDIEQSLKAYEEQGVIVLPGGSVILVDHEKE